MLNITHQRNANQNNSEVPSHASQNQKVYLSKSLQTINSGELWRKGNPVTLLVGIQTSTATMENNVEMP